jgi:hypothetical protein
MPNINNVNFVAGARPGDPEVFTPTEVTIRTYGFVTWSNFLPRDVDVTFDDTTNVAMPFQSMCDNMVISFVTYNIPGTPCGAGNMVLPAVTSSNLKPFTGQFRQFPVAGVYPFHSSNGAMGRVVVVEP